jgi:hypothetical protein
MNKIIFLDVDGVLNTRSTIRRTSDGCPFVDARKVLRLRDIVERTGASIVLSSSWKYGATKGSTFWEQLAYCELQEEFRRLRCPLWIDATPCFPQTKRWREINAWLMLHDVDNFVILDDLWEELLPFSDHLVTTTQKEGLTKERAELAISILNKGE